MQDRCDRFRIRQLAIRFEVAADIRFEVRLEHGTIEVDAGLVVVI